MRRWPAWCPTWLLIALFVFIVRLPALTPSVIDPDESLFILMGRELLHGHLPYVDVFDNKPFGVPAAFALALAIFGQSVIAARILGSLCVMATALFLRLLARAIGIQEAAAIAVAILYAAFSTQVDGLATTSEILLAPFTTAAVLALITSVRQIGSPQRLYKSIFAAGLCFGLALWIKYVPAVAATILFAGLMLYLVCGGKVRLATACALAVVFGLACALPTVLTGGFYAAFGHWAEFWHANFGYMAGYVAQPALWQGIKVVAEQAVMQLWPLFVLAAAGFVIAFTPTATATGLDRVGVIAAACWLVAEFIASIAPMHFFDHYFLMLLPPAALLAGVALHSATFYWLRPTTARFAMAALAVYLAFIPIMGVVHSLTRDWLNLGAPDASRRIAKIIREDTQPNPTLWVVNTPPIIIYFQAGVPLPTRYPFAAHLIGGLDGLITTDSMSEIRRILAERPRYIVVDWQDWHELRSEVQPLVKEALQRDYEQIATATGGKRDLALYRIHS